MNALLGEGETIATRRLRLLPLAPYHLETMSSWLQDALAPEWTLEQVEASAGRSAAVAINEAGDAQPIGIGVLAQASRERSAVFEFIGVDPAARYRGLGGEAALALEREARKRWRTEAVYAPVPEGRGLAVYFWLRLGYHALIGDQGPGPVVGLGGEHLPGIWMAREDP